jgi:hypothetical protein
MHWDQITAIGKQFAHRVSPWSEAASGEAMLTVVDKVTLAPLRFVPVAQWATEASSAVALNEQGELLLFHDNRVVFAREDFLSKYISPETIVLPRASKAPIRVTMDEVRQALCGLEAQIPPGNRAGGRDSTDRKMSARAREKIANLRQLLQAGSASGKAFHPWEGAAVLTLDGDVLATRAILLVRNGHSNNADAGHQEPAQDAGIRINIEDEGYLQVFMGDDIRPLLSFA